MTKTGKRASLLAVTGIVAGAWGGAAMGEEAAIIDADGTLHVHAITTIAASEFLSPELKKAYIAQVKGSLASITVPSVGSPKSEWDKFDALMDRGTAGALAWYKEHYPVDVADTQMGGVHVGIITPKGEVSAENRGRVLINLHGGGFCGGRGLSQGELESIAIASVGRIKIITVDYREAPYAKYPAGSEDAAKVYQEVLKDYRPGSVGIFGGSAGGVLTAQVIAWLQNKGLPRPGAAGVFWSGAGHFDSRGDSQFWGFAAVPQAEDGAMNGVLAAANWYLSGAAASDPVADPTLSDAVLSQFPPTLFLTGTRSFDMSPAVTSHARLLKLGVTSQLYIIEGGWHGTSLQAGVPEANDANAYIAHWFIQQLGR